MIDQFQSGECGVEKVYLVNLAETLFAELGIPEKASGDMRVLAARIAEEAAQLRERAQTSSKKQAA